MQFSLNFIVEIMLLPLTILNIWLPEYQMTELTDKTENYWKGIHIKLAEMCNSYFFSLKITKR